MNDLNNYSTLYLFNYHSSILSTLKQCKFIIHQSNKTAKIGQIVKSIKEQLNQFSIYSNGKLQIDKFLTSLSSFNDIPLPILKNQFPSKIVGLSLSFIQLKDQVSEYWKQESKKRVNDELENEENEEENNLMNEFYYVSKWILLFFEDILQWMIEYVDKSSTINQMHKNDKASMKYIETNENKYKMAEYGKQCATIFSESLQNEEEINKYSEYLILKYLKDDVKSYISKVFSTYPQPRIYQAFAYLCDYFNNFTEPNAYVKLNEEISKLEMEFISSRLSFQDLLDKLDKIMKHLNENKNNRMMEDGNEEDVEVQINIQYFKGIEKCNDNQRLNELLSEKLTILPLYYSYFH